MAATQRKDRLVFGLLCLAFLSVGSFAFVSLFVLPAWRVTQANDWVATPCTIISCELREVRGGGRRGGTSYHLDVVYEYAVDGKTYRSDRFQFVGGGGFEHGRREFAERFPAGVTTTCFVDPDDPSQAVLERGMTADIWMALLLVLFPLVGSVGLLWAVGLIGRRGREKDIETVA